MTVAIVRFALVSALAAGAVGSTTFPGAAAGALTSQSFVAAADAYVSSASPSTNFGSDTGLVVDGAPLGATLASPMPISGSTSRASMHR